jgi:hypothetical protein
MNENNRKFVKINETLATCTNEESKRSQKMNTHSKTNNNGDEDEDVKQMNENEYISRKNYISNQYKMASVSYGMLFCLIGVVLTYY